MTRGLCLDTDCGDDLSRDQELVETQGSTVTALLGTHNKERRMAKKLYEEARTALEECDMDWQEALKVLLPRVFDDDEALEEAVKHASWHAIQITAANVRQQYFAQAGDKEDSGTELPGGGVSGERYARTSGGKLREIAYRSWYNYMLPGGQRLGDADHGALEKAHSRYDSLSKSNAQRAQFIEMVMQNVPADGTIVREAMGDEQIEQIAKESLNV